MQRRVFGACMLLVAHRHARPLLKTRCFDSVKEHAEMLLFEPTFVGIATEQQQQQQEEELWHELQEHVLAKTGENKVT